jgi:hypothetical protein
MLHRNIALILEAQHIAIKGEHGLSKDGSVLPPWR